MKFSEAVPHVRGQKCLRCSGPRERVLGLITEEESHVGAVCKACLLEFVSTIITEWTTQHESDVVVAATEAGPGQYWVELDWHDDATGGVASNGLVLSSKDPIDVLLARTCEWMGGQGDLLAVGDQLATKGGEA